MYQLGLYVTRVLLLNCRVEDMTARTEEACQSQLMSVNSLNRFLLFIREKLSRYIASIFAWMWKSFGYYSWRVKRPNIFTWMSFSKWYRGPSRMISHVIIISYIALPHAHAHFDWASSSPHCSSTAEIFHFRLIRIHSNARNSILNAHGLERFSSKNQNKVITTANKNKAEHYKESMRTLGK